ncbi:MAG TPA: serine/threonine-protein kinase [Vicinamibacterales bacterium]
MAERAITDLVDAVTNGEAVDWPAARDRLASSKGLSVAEGLEVLSRLNAGATSRPGTTSARPRLPALFEFARIAAIACCALGVAGGIQIMLGPAPGGAAIRTLILLVFAGAALFLDAGSTDRRARALALAYWTNAAAFSMRGAAALVQQWPDAWWLQLAAAIRPESFFPAALWQFAREFPLVSRFSRLDAVCVGALHLTMALGVALFAINFMPVLSPGGSLTTMTAPLQRATGFDPWFWNILVASALPALAVIAIRGRKASGPEAARVRAFLYAIALSIGPTLLEVIAEGIFPSYARLMHTPQALWWGGWVLYPPLFALPIITAYTVKVHDVLDVRVAIQQGLRYLLAKWLITWGSVVPLVALLGFIYVHRHRSMAELMEIREAQVLILLSAFAGVALLFRSPLMRLVDRWAFPEGADPSAMLAHMTDRLNEMRTPLEITSLFARASEQALQATSAAYLVHSGRLVPSREGDVPLPRRSLIPVLLEGGREPCIVSPRYKQSYFGLVTDEDRRWITQQNIAVIVPVLAGRQKGLLGAISLKSRRNAIAFSQDDFRFLRAGSAAASLACDVLHADAVPAVDAVKELDEVAIQCDRCGLVETWSSVDRKCTCGGSWEPAVLPKRLGGRLEIRQKLGAGGMGVVYKGVDVRLKRDVAVKTLPSLSETAASRLTTEAQTMAGLSHSHVAILYSTELWRGTPVLVMEFLPGGTLAARLRRGRLRPSEAAGILLSLTPALEQMHRAGLYHGDIKPSNIGFAANDVPKFLDFGLTRAIARTPSQEDRGEHAETSRSHGPVAGTLPYLSPEVRDGAPPGPALDLWAMCVVFCESVLGVNPFLEVHSTSDLPRATSLAVAQIRALAYPEVADYLEAALRTEQNRRPQTAGDLWKQLGAFANQPEAGA